MVQAAMYVAGLPVHANVLHAALCLCLLQTHWARMLLVGQWQHVLRLPTMPGPQSVPSGYHCCLLDRAKVRLYIVIECTTEETLRCRFISL